MGNPEFGPFFLDSSGSLEYSLPGSSCLKGAGFLGLEYRNKVKLLLSLSVFCNGVPLLLPTTTPGILSPRIQVLVLSGVGRGQLLAFLELGQESRDSVAP